jgi:eukaryotic-like serine/threonine-protein kinase
VLDTVKSAPNETIVPPELRGRRDTGGINALELLRELATTSPVASVQLHKGEVIGEGGMGIVRSAEQVALGRLVAIKTLRPDRRDPGAALDLLREAWITGTLEHPNVVPVHYLGVEDDGSPLIVLKRIEGLEWSALLADPEAVARRFGATDLLAWNLGILMSVLNALRFAHHRGVIHRDLKPSNVMIGDFGEVYLLDWGIAVSLVDDRSGRLPLARDATELAGTPSYMAPEMLGRESGPPLSERTDVYLAGSVLFELIAGRPPHQGNSAIEVLASVIESRPELPAHVPAELARICKRAMDVDPDARFESVEALRLALQAYLEHRGSAELVVRARERLDELLSALSGSYIDREEISRLFGACRFGFHEALAVWRDNADARAGLARASIAVAEYELAAGNPGSAVAMLAELDDPPAPLLAKAREAAAARVERDAEVEALLAANDSSVGRRTRSWLTALLGATFTIAPLIIALFPGVFDFSHRNLIVWSVVAEVVVAFGVWLAWDTLSSTILNRRFAAAALFLFAAEAMLAFGGWVAGLTPVTSQLFTLFMWGTCVGMMAITIDPWFAPASAGYFIAFLVTSRIPTAELFLTSGANALFTVNAVIRWRPGTFWMTEAERAWLEERVRTRRGARGSRRRLAAGAPPPTSTGGSG